MAQLKDLIVNGPSRFIGDVYATTFTGNLAGNANTATNATNAGMIAGLSVHSGRNNEANKIVRTDQNGYLQVGYINSSSGHEKNASNPTYVWGSNSSDSYLRSYQTSSLSVNYATTSGSCSGNAATATNASSAGNADKLDGVHYQNILERYYSGYSSSGTATGWFRIAETLITDDGGVTFLLAIQRGYSYTNNESYLFSISVSFGGGISITQLSGYANTRLITKIRVDWTHRRIAYVDLYISSSSKTNDYFWYTVGCAKSYTTWIANPTLVGRYPQEFTTVQGCKSDKGFTGYLTGTASSASKWTYPRTITLTGSVTGSVSIDGSSDVTLATTTNHTHTFGSLTSKPTTISGYGITDAYTASTIDSKLSGYLSLSGGTMTGTIIVDSYTAFGPTGGNFYLGTPKYPLLLRSSGTTTINGNTLIHSGNYNSYAPKLDGTGAKGTWGINISGNAATADNLAKTFIENINYAAHTVGLKLIRYDDNWKANGFPGKWTSGLSVMTGYCGWQLVTYGGSADTTYFRKVSDSGVWSNWRALAFTDSNVASATKLATSRTIWGQSFDGTGNVSGALTGVTNITASGNTTIAGNVGIGTTSPSYKLHVVGDGYFTDNVITESDFSSRGNAIIDGYVGIGTNSPSYKLHVVGNGYFSGSLTASGHTKVTSLKASNICIECDNSGNTAGHTSEINNYSRPLYIQYSTSNNCCICYGGGNVGIGIASPTYKLHVSGDARINGTISCIKLSQTSDIKYKTNIKQIEYEEALKIIENLNPVTWDWNENTIATGSSSGFVAQEAEEFIPNAISRDNENNLSLDYTQLHSYEIKVIQEQQKEIIKLKEKLKILEKLIS